MNDDDDRSSSERLGVLATVGGVVAIVLVVVVANLLGRSGSDDDAPTPQAAAVPSSPLSTSAADLATMSPEEIASSALEERGEVAQALPSGAKSLANAAEALAGDQPFDFVLTSFNILGSQHTAPGGAASEYAPGRIRTEWAASLVNAYGSSVVGLQEIQRDQVDALDRALGGTWDFWPGEALGGGGVPQSLMWSSAVWTPTFQGSITVPFMGGTRPQPVVRLQHNETGREIYVLNIHNSPRDAQGREPERDKAMAIEAEAVNELKKDGIPVFLVGDFNEHDEAFCYFTSRAGMIAANGGSNSGGRCLVPRPNRVDWIFGTPDIDFSGFLLDEGPAVRRITDHAVLTTTVSVP
ncbi:endonuclease/exonuclease/phosphatase family protein [Nocardioides psychrotolerans]|uniref:endonuclease/exonuclease/phosphatase family protein n=1 Tax=Nocardioides psychrotolerans TaxID=1005945 RepID=UPI0031380280